MENENINDLQLNLTMSLGDFEELNDYLERVEKECFSIDEPQIAKDIRAKFDLLLSEIEAGIAEAADAAMGSIE